jgi:rhodanese-related sulfurtransferase
MLIGAAPASAPDRNPQIDYAGFSKLTLEVQPYRERRLLSLADFRHVAARPDSLILDARSADAYAAGHLKGAVNLPFTDFTAASLAATIGNPDRPILIYCNNNFANDVPRKAIALALNIQTFVNLVGYGYRNVYELNEVIDFRDRRVDWVAAEVRSSPI